MNTLLLALHLTRKTDLLVARQTARRAAELLGFDPYDQVCLAAATFDLACQALDRTDQASVRFEIGGEMLQIHCGPTTGQTSSEEWTKFRLSKQLPASAAVSRKDVPWMLEQVVNLAPRDAFAEVRRVNQELLRALLDLAAARVKQPAPATQNEPHAA
jgi:hypothetical protein